jgi:hypothetical protein
MIILYFLKKLNEFFQKVFQKSYVVGFNFNLQLSSNPDCKITYNLNKVRNQLQMADS